MRLLTVVRTRNEEANIANFIRGYRDIGDAILVADGGSDDMTLMIATNFFDVKVRAFTQRVGSGERWRNPEGPHVNFLLDWAAEEGADWVILDDCDCWPNAALRRQGRIIIEEADAAGLDAVFAVRLYLWGNDRHFRHLAMPGNGHKDWEPSLWAWRVSSGLRAEGDWNIQFSKPLDAFRAERVVPPLCLLHHPWPTEEALRRKMDFYNKSEADGVRLNDPRTWAGPLEPLPEWAKE